MPDEAVEEPDDGRRVPPPRCAHCAGPVRPGVVWFGEALPTAALEAAVEAASTCDLLVTVGTSGLVYPAAEIPQVAARFGATVLQVNPQETPLDAVSDVNLRGPAAPGASRPRARRLGCRSGVTTRGSIRCGTAGRAMSWAGASVAGSAPPGPAYR